MAWDDTTEHIDRIIVKSAFTAGACPSCGVDEGYDLLVKTLGKEEAEAVRVLFTGLEATLGKGAEDEDDEGYDDEELESNEQETGDINEEAAAAE